MPKVEKVLSAPPNGTLGPSRNGSTQDMSANIKVAVRVRPLNEKETDCNTRIIVDVVDDRMLVFDPKEEPHPFYYHGVKQPNNNYLKRANKELKFVFDHVCGPDSSNIDVFETTTKDMIMCLMDGYNCSVFVYGATGAGKTFTMIGNKENPGITYLTMDHLFNIMNSYKKDREFDIAVSYIEVYNENVYDLINPSKTPLQLHEDSKFGVIVARLTPNNINTARELLNILENGNKNRTQHPTDANAESSRSHAVFQVYVKMRYKTSSEFQMVKLSMIDLAGSERAAATGCVGERFKEGANINRSLLSLGNCINRLADGSNYIPYRDSKLTRLLKDSLGGNCKTVMIANISPSSLSYDDTYNTLKYAARANKIQLSIKKNIVDGGMRMSQYVKIVDELKKKVKELEAKLSLSSVHVTREPDLAAEQAKKDWRLRIIDQQNIVNSLVSQLLSLQTRQRVLALRHRLHTDGYSQVADLAHRSSSEAMEQVYTEDIPRQGRAADSYIKQSIQLHSLIHKAWNKWHDKHNKFDALLNQALSECPGLEDFIKNVKQDTELRLTKARDNLRFKLLSIAVDEVNSLRQYTIDMPSMLRKLYLTLKGYGKMHPALTDEYLEIMKKAKSVKTITWSDQDSESNTIDPHFKFISTLDLDKPSNNPDYNFCKNDANMVANIETDSDNISDAENQEPIKLTPRKRKSTPIKLWNNETIVIDDSLENLDATKMLNSAKKIKREANIVNDVENFEVIDPKDLNSTFVLAGKFDGLKKQPIEMKTESILKKEFADRTNIMGQTRRPPNPTGTAKIVKSEVQVGKAAIFKKINQHRPVAGFGSSVSRDGTPLQRNFQECSRKANINKTVGFKAIRVKERHQTHPYVRNNTR